MPETSCQIFVSLLKVDFLICKSGSYTLTIFNES